MMKTVFVTATGDSDSNYCFKNYNEKHSACRGRLHVHDDRTNSNTDECCKKGQGHAAEVFYSERIVSIFISISDMSFSVRISAIVKRLITQSAEFCQKLWKLMELLACFGGAVGSVAV